MNRQLTTLGDVREHVKTISKNYWDNQVSIRNVQFLGLSKVMIGGSEYTMKPAAQRGISNRLGIPYPYLERCEPLLQAENMNTWLKQERNEKLFFRFDADKVRAIFTPRYTPIDNLQVLDRLREQGFNSDAPVQYSVDDEFFMLNIPDREKSFQIKKGDEMRPGISIGNSEVGLSSLTIAAFVLRLVCTNGLISQTSVESSYRHVSHRIVQEFPQVLNQVTMELDKQRNQWVISNESQVENPESTLKSFNRQFNLDKSETDAVEWAWNMESGNTMFHIVNAYTKAAQFPQLPTASEFRLQKVGGSILAMLN